MANRLIVSMAVALGLPILSWAQGAVLDPTRPPAAVLSVTGSADGGPVAAGPVLQSVLVPLSGRPSAVIDGQTLHLGDKVGEGVIVRIAESEVVLKGRGGSTVLRLTPEVEKHLRTPAVQKRKNGPLGGHVN